MGRTNPSQGGAEYGRGNTTLLLTRGREVDVHAQRESRRSKFWRWTMYPPEVRTRLHEADGVILKKRIEIEI